MHQTLREAVLVLGQMFGVWLVYLSSVSTAGSLLFHFPSLEGNPLSKGEVIKNKANYLNIFPADPVPIYELLQLFSSRLNPSVAVCKNTLELP